MFEEYDFDSWDSKFSSDTSDPGKTFNDPSFSMEGLLDSSRRRSPTSQFSDIPQSKGLHRQPQTDRSFKEYQAWDSGSSEIKDRYQTSKDIYGGYEKRKKLFFENSIKPLYQGIYSSSPRGDEEVIVSELDDYFTQNSEDQNSGKWGTIKEQWGRVNNNFLQAQGKYLSEQAVYLDREEQTQAVDPSFKRAFEGWSKTKKATKGDPKELLGGEEYARFLDVFNVEEGDLLSDTLKGSKGSNDKKSQIAELRDLILEQNQIEYLTQEGFQVPPSNLGKIGGISNKLTTNERKALLLKRAKKLGSDTILVDGKEVPIDQVSDSEMTDEDEQRFTALDQYFKVQTTHTEAIKDYYANYSNMTDEEREQGADKNELLLAAVREKAISLEAAGIFDDMVGRISTKQDMMRVTSWIKTGTINAEQSKYGRDLLLSGADEIDAPTFEKLATLNQELSKLQSIQVKEGHSPMAELSKMSQEEGDEGWLDAIGKWLGNPEAIAQVVTESLSSLIPAYLDNAPLVVGGSAAAGLAIGTAVPGAGTVAGGAAGTAWGLRLNYGVTSALLEGTSKIMESMQESGVDIHNPEQMAIAWANPDFVSEVKEKAALKSLPIGLVDTVSAGMAGKANALLKAPSTMKKVASPKRYFKGLNNTDSDELMSLRKLKKRSELSEKDTARMLKLEKAASKRKTLVPTESAFSRSLNLADKQVHRYTVPQKLKAGAVELGAQATFGATGELAGQLLSREPGEALDKHAILGEVFGELGGAGVGGITAPYDLFRKGGGLTKKENRNMAGSGFVVKEEKEIQAPPDAQLPYSGKMATVDRAGWEHESFTPNDATDAVAYIAEKSGEPVTIESPDPEKTDKVQNPKLQVLNEYIGSVMNMVAETREKGSVKIAITDRTPQGSKNKGFVEENPETGEFYIYLNPEAAKAQNDDILGAAIHEFPHILGKGYYGTERVVKWYDTLTPDQKDQALAHYVFKDTRAHQDFSKAELSADERTLLNQAKSQLSKEEMAHDWFSLEYARVLLGQQNEKSFKEDSEGNTIITGLPEGEFNTIRELIDNYVFKPYSKYIGSGARRANPEMFGQGIENRVSESADALVPSEQKMRPEKMGPDEMYADILSRSQWTVTPDQQLIYNGPDKQPSVGRAPSSIENLMEQRNLLLTDEKTVRTLERIAGVLPKDALKINRDPQGNVAYDKTGKAYTAQATETRDKEEVSNFVESEVAEASKPTAIGTKKEPNQPVKQTPASVVGNQEGVDPREDIKTDKFEESQKRGRAKILKELGAKESVEQIDEKISKVIKKAQEKGIPAEKLMGLPDVKRLQEKRLEAKNLEDIADKKMQEMVDKTTEKASVNPGVNKGLETVSDEAVTEALITNLENRRKDFKTRFKGKTPEEKVGELKKLLASDDEAFMEQTKEIAADLLDKKGRLTVEELLGAVSRAYGLDQLTDTQREARGLVSNRAEINSIDEAYAVAEQGVEDLIKRLDLKESDIAQEVADINLEKGAANEAIKKEADVNAAKPEAERKESTQSKNLKKKVEDFDKRIEKLNKRKSRIQRVRETIGVGSEVTNIDWRDVEVSGTGVAGDGSPYGNLLVQGKGQEKRLTLGDLVYDNKIEVKFKKGKTYGKRTITNPTDLLKEIIEKSFTPEAAQNWSKEIPQIQHLKPKIRARLGKDPNYKINPQTDYVAPGTKPQTYGEYAMSLLGAMSSMREGRAQFDKHSKGAKIKSYFEADSGANLFGILASRIQLLQQNIVDAPTPKMDEVTPLKTYKNLKKYMAAFDEQVMYSENPEKNPEGKIPAPIAAQDRILLNIAYTQLALDHFGRASNKVGENVYYNRATTDHMLAAEEELDSNIEYLESVLESGRAPDKVAILGETFKKGDLFRYGNEIRRATKPFTMSQVFQNPNVLGQVSELSGGNFEAQKISEDDKKKISALLESAKQTRERYSNYQLGFDDNDILNTQPQVDEYGTPLTYRHWLLNINERLAAEGPAKADIPFGGFHKSQRPQKNSSSLEDPIYTGNRFNLDERQMALGKAKENLANGNPTPEDLKLLSDEAFQNQIVTSQARGITNRDSTMSGKLAGQLAAGVAKKNDNSELNNSPIEVQRELLSNPSIDRQFNLALYLRRMVLRGDQRLPESMRTITVTDQNGESRIIELDEILGNPEYEAIWKSQNESLKNFNFHYDNLSEKSDPLFSISSDDSNVVKEYFVKDEARKGKSSERNVTTRLKAADVKVLKANLGLIEDKALRSEIRSLLNSTKDIVLDMGDTTTSVDRLPKYFNLNADGKGGNIFDSDVGDKLSVPSEDSKKPYAIVEVVKIPKNNEQFNRDFDIAKASNNLLDFLVKNKIVKEVEKLESMPIDVIEASHQEVTDLIRGEREKLSEVQGIIDSFQNRTEQQGPINEPTLDALFKARDELKKTIREAEKDVESGGRTGGFNIDGYRLSMGSGKLGGGPVLTTQSKGRWALQDKRAKNKTPQRFSNNLKKDDEIQAFFNNIFLERALSEKITVQDEFDPGIQQENLSSFVVTPRKLAQFVNDMGLKNINQLSGSYSKYKAESRGGIELLRFVPGVLDEMLNDLGSINQEKIKRVEALKKAYVGTAQEAVIEKHLNRLYQQEATFKGYSMADRVMLQHVAEVKESRSKSLKQPQEFSKADIDFGLDLAKKGRGQAFTIAVDSAAPKFTRPTVVYLGQVEIDLKNGKKFKKNVRAIVSPTNRGKTGYIAKQSKKDYESNKSNSIKESGRLTTKDLQTVTGTNNIPLKDVGSRWPTKAEDAFVYDVKLLDSDSELTNALLTETKQQFDAFSARDKKKVEKFYEDLNTLGEEAQGDKKRIFEKLRLAEEGLNKLFAFDALPSLDKARDLASPKKGYNDLFNAKVSAITGLVQEAGGIKVPTQKDIRQAEKNIEMDFQNMFDKPGETQEQSTTDFYSDDAMDSYEMDREDTDLQEALDDLYKTGLGFGVNPDPDISNMDDPFTSSSDFIGRDPGVLGRLSEGLGQRANRIQEAILGKRKPPEDGFIKDRSDMYKDYVEQFAALEDFHPQVEKALGLGKNSSESERLNAYSEAYATMGRTGSLMDEVTRESINPIKEAIYQSKVDMTKLGNYLIGLVSPQVNRAVANNRESAGLDALVDENGKPAGSGLTDAQAQAMVESALMDQGVREFVNHKHNPIDKIFNLHQKSLEMMVNSEMIPQGQYDKMLRASLDGNGNFRRLPFKGMWWLDNSEFANQKAIDDLFGGSSRASGKGFDQPKKEGMTTGSMGRQLGSYANPLGMLEHAISFHQETVIRSQRNVVARKIVEMHNKLRDAYRKDPNSYAGKLYTQTFEAPIDQTKLEYKSITDEQTQETVGSVQQVIIPESLADQKRLFYARVQGEPIMLKFASTKNGGAMAQALKNLKYQPLKGFAELVSKGTQFMARMITSWNPEFWLRNPVRDTSAVYFNLAGSNTGRKLRNSIINPKKFAAQVKAIAKYERSLENDGQTPKEFQGLKNSKVDLARLDSDPMYAYHLMKQNGGKTAFYVFKSVDQLQKEMLDFSKQKLTNPANIIRKVSKYVDLINVSLENAYRVRTFSEFIKAGKPIERAIREARNVTVDFNKKGINSQQLGAFLLFANPAIQGTKRTFKAFMGRDNPTATAAKLFSLGLTLNFVARMLSEKDEDEDDGRTYHDDRGNVKNSTSMSLPMDIFFDNKQGRNLDLPIDFALSPIWGLSELAAKHLYHANNEKYSPDLIEDLWEYFKVASAGVAPIPSSINMFPAADPIVEVMANKDHFTGRPIYDEGTKYKKITSPQDMNMNNTAEWAKKFSKFLNEAGGGNQDMPGNWLNVLGPLVGRKNLTTDVRQGQFNMGHMVSGPVIQHLVENYLGGLGKMGSDLLDHAVAPNSKKSKKIPLLNAVFKAETSNWYLKSRYYDLLLRVDQAKAHLNKLEDENDFSGLKEYQKSNPETKPLIQMMERAQRGLQANRRLKSKLDKNKTLSESVKMQRDEELEQKGINIMGQIVIKAHKLGVAI